MGKAKERGARGRSEKRGEGAKTASARPAKPAKKRGRKEAAKATTKKGRKGAAKATAKKGRKGAAKATTKKGRKGAAKATAKKGRKAAAKPKSPPKRVRKEAAKSPAKRAAARPAAYSVARATADAVADRSPLGAHVSTAGGASKAPARGLEIGASAIQIFTNSPNQWSAKEIPAAEAAAFREALAPLPIRFTTSHDSYLINLASPDATHRAKSLEAFIAELRRSTLLGLDAVVSHPGNFIDDRAGGLARNADGITQALEAVPGNTRLLMELTAGQGTVLGSSFEEMRDLLDRIGTAQRHRVGVCLDTCHVFAAGYDLVRDYDGVWARFAGILGYDLLGCIHLNDSRGALGSHLDRHELIGDGQLGDAPFRHLMNDERLFGVPKILETPKGDDLVTNDRRMLKKLRAFARG